MKKKIDLIKVCSRLHPTQKEIDDDKEEEAEDVENSFWWIQSHLVRTDYE